MPEHIYDVVGIGNALVDVITHHPDEFVEEQGIVKGSMTLIDAERAVYLYEALGAGVEMSGGSAANTMTGVASFGGKAAYIGKVADDSLGEVFGHDLRAVGVAFQAVPAMIGVPTGRCLIIVTPDAQRTMNTCLGMAELLGPDDIDEELVASAKVVYLEGYLWDRPPAMEAYRKAAKVVYLEGYLWDRPPAMEAYRKAAKVAHANGGKVSLSLSDSFCVHRHRHAFHDLVESEVDLLFANEAEILALYEVDTLDEALRHVRGHCEVAAITLGARGSVVLSGDETIEVPVQPVDEVVDTTGAGDLYAAGFLYGYTRGMPLAECGRLGSVAAAEVISHVGARPLVNLRRLAGL